MNLLYYMHCTFDSFDIHIHNIISISFFFSFAKEFGHPDWQGYGSFIHQWTKRYGIVNKAICGSKESAAHNDELETWKEMVLLPTLARYSPNDIYNGDETAILQVVATQNLLLWQWQACRLCKM